MEQLFLLLSISNNCVLSFFLKKYEKTSLHYPLISNHLTTTLKKTSKKSAKKFAELKKRRTFAPANETISALVKKTTRTLT